MAFQERLDMLLETYYSDFDLQDEITNICYLKYPEHCLSSVERAFKLEKDAFNDLCDKVVKIQNEITGDKDIPRGELLDLIKKITTIRKEFPKLVESYEKMESRFIKEKGEARLRGGRKLSLSEKNLI
jgi:hypothetical protein